MTAIAHTPGPWQANYNGSIGHIKSVYPDHPYGWTPTLAKFMGENRAQSIGDDEALANAFLMAASPDLLEAAKMAIDFIEHPEKYPDCQPVYGMLRGAIHKATKVCQ